MLPRVCHICFPIMQKNSLASSCLLIDCLMSRSRFLPILLLMQRPYSKICDKCWRFYCCTTWMLFFFCVTTLVSKWFLSNRGIVPFIPSISPFLIVCYCIAWPNPPGLSVDLPNLSSKPAPHPLQSSQLTRHLSFENTSGHQEEVQVFREQVCLN